MARHVLNRDLSEELSRIALAIAVQLDTRTRTRLAVENLPVDPEFEEWAKKTAKVLHDDEPDAWKRVLDQHFPPGPLREILSELDIPKELGFFCLAAVAETAPRERAQLLAYLDDPSKFRNCAGCGRMFEFEGSRGRPRQYHSRACSQRIYEEKRKRSRRAKSE
ncbi:hypothetical protein ACFYV7_40455 [Nocardia suismassiliense]|uniref:CGNR zinc finger domain-containing protein n=1 Tax=Nocardia suismassiliense TaxID=2077092 RepID=A0ABW6R6J6_9NOCA